MASLAATNWPKPLVLVPCLSWSTASAVFTEGVMSQSINWDNLETQFHSDGNYSERLAKMVNVVDDSFLAGKRFVTNFNQSMKELQSDIKDVKQTDLAINYHRDNNLEVVKIDGKEELCPNLLEKLMSKDATQLSQTEIKKLNEKIHEIQNKMRGDKTTTIIMVQPKSITSTTLEVATNAMNGITSAFYAGTTQLMNLILPSTPEKLTPNKIDITKTNWWEREALQFMRGVMDECTHLKNFSVPVDTSLIIVVCAKDDAYVPRDGCTSLEDLWPGADVKYLDAGHVSAYVLYQKLFR